MKQQYKARWAQPGKPSLGNVTFDAHSDESAKKLADKIAVQICLTNTPRTLDRFSNSGRGSFVCIETLNTGRTWPV